MRRTYSATCVAPLVVAGAIVAMLATPSAQRRRNDNAAFGMPVATNTIVDDPGTYVGKQVTISAGVEQMLSKTAFLVDQRKVVSATDVQPIGKPMLVIAPYLTRVLDQQKYFLMTGQVVKFDVEAVARVVSGFTVDLPAELSAKYQGQPVLIATSVIDSKYAELARKPLPPPSADEVAMTIAMKTISSSFAALRTGTQEAKADVVTKSALALQPAFTSVESIWDGLGQVPAAQWARDARAHSAAIERSATAGDWEGVRSSTTALNQLCQSCHGVYRERQEDTSFRFKPGTF